MADNAINKLVFPGDEIDQLSKKYGQPNVERTMIYILEQREPRTDLIVNIPYTADRIEKILDAVHGDYLDG